MDNGNPDDPGDRKPNNPAGDNAIPLPNGGRSPFELDPNPNTPKPPPVNPGGDPFTTPNPPTATPPVPGGRPSTSASRMEMPQLPSTSPSTSYESPLVPGSIAMAPEATLASTNSTDSRPDLGPLPAQPVSIPNNLTSPSDPVNQPMMGTPAPAPAQAPRRRGFLSNLFGPKNTQNR